jgi:16S rRNA processing protein RimM
MALLEIGRIVGSHGLAGRVKVLSYLESPVVLQDLSEVWVGRNLQGAAAHRLEAVQPGRGSFILKLGEVSDRETAVKFKGLTVWMASDRLNKLPEGEFYWHEIIGLNVLTEEGRHLGVIESVFPTGSNDVYVCRSGEEEVLLPATGEVVRRIDLDRKVMVVRLLKGLMEHDPL